VAASLQLRWKSAQVDELSQSLEAVREACQHLLEHGSLETFGPTPTSVLPTSSPGILSASLSASSSQLPLPSIGSAPPKLPSSPPRQGAAGTSSAAASPAPLRASGSQS
jgi:hypothetical protein